ncbi:hypothetical protein Bca52824_074982 [Brassica carinata]|uniref:Rab-GAP TBC domain-containing protein n=1 Tax=Brassica carinata TaxID=52824 RepID=A0A8X7PR73_BRACI|nr:hypothetical protein Bca52824_074982 [Brassica carinata]
MWSAPPPPLSFNDDDGHSPATKAQFRSSALHSFLGTEERYQYLWGNGNSGVPSAEDFSRQAHLSADLSKKVINMKELRSSSLQSLSDSPGIRSTVWKVLLGYLTPERSLWSTELKQKRSQYKHYKDELLTTSLDECTNLTNFDSPPYYLSIIKFSFKILSQMTLINYDVLLQKDPAKEGGGRPLWLHSQVAFVHIIIKMFKSSVLNSISLHMNDGNAAKVRQRSDGKITKIN